MSLKSRFDFVSQRKLCRNYLHVGHIASKCIRRGLCKQCPNKHNDVLHDSNFHTVVQNVNEAPNSDTVLNVTRNDLSKSVAGIACVEVLVEGCSALYRCKAIVDQISCVNLCLKMASIVLVFHLNKILSISPQTKKLL